MTDKHYETVIQCVGCVNGITLGRKPRKCTECTHGFVIELSVPESLQV